MANPAQPAIQALATQINSSMQRAIRDQRTYTETMAEQVIRDGHVQGFVNLASDGEHVVAISFPLSFMERPVFTYGLEMGDNTWFVQGDFPVHSATVGDWSIMRPGGATLYTGAILGVVVIGAARSILHYSFEGRTFTVPTGTEMTVSTTL
jgi:hypothetical protein